MVDGQENELDPGALTYEELHVPALFRQWADTVLDLAELGQGHRVVDVACGTGILARVAVDRVAPGGSVVGVDPNDGMLGVARSLDRRVDWREGVAEDLPVSDESVDAVVSQFGFMFFGDQPRSVREMSRVLMPGGRVAVAVWDSVEASPAYSRLVDLLDRLAGRAAADALRSPFTLGDAGRLQALFEGGGFPSTSVVTRTGTARFPSLRAMVEAELRGWLPVMGVDLAEETIGEVLSAAEEELADLVDTDGRAVFDLSAHVAIATKGA